MSNNEHDAVATAKGSRRSGSRRDGEGARAAHLPERKCILSGAHGERAEFVRLALAPDGAVLPDLRAKAPGRGAWIGVGRTALESAIAKGKLKGALARAFKTSEILVPADLADLIETDSAGRRSTASGSRRAPEQSSPDRTGLATQRGGVNWPCCFMPPTHRKMAIASSTKHGG